jgi:hypothetical protein
VVLSRERGEIRLDFGESTSIRAVWIQADPDHEYAFEAAPDGADGMVWSPIWRAPSLPGRGLRIREHVLTDAVAARSLRIRPAGGARGDVAAVGAVRVYSEVPDGWPAPPGVSPGSSPLTFPWLSVRGIEVAKVAVALAGALLLLLSAPGSARPWLVIVALASFLGWWNFLQISDHDYRRNGRNYWDVYNYYVAAKYAPEIGYTNLYRCVLAADAEDGFRGLHASRVLSRDLETNRMVPTARILGEMDRCRERFADERWAGFKRDHAWFRARIPANHWLQLPQDHGYNASPAWTLLGGALANLGGMSERQFVLLASIDTLLLVLMWYAVWSAFGGYAACAAVLFWGTNLVAGNGFTAGAFLRQGWLFLAVVGVCCLKRERRGIAGFLLAWSALLKIFPGFLIVGVALKAVAGMLGRHSLALSVGHRRFAAGVAAGLVAILGLSIFASGDPGVWGRFARNTAKHAATPQFQAVGVHALLLHIDRPDLREGPRVVAADLEASYRRSGPRILSAVLAVLFLPLLLRAVRGEEDWVAAILGLAWLPFVVGITNYYWSIFLLFGLLVVDRRAVGPAFALVLIPLSVLGLVYGVHGLGLFTWGSLVLVLFLLGVTVLYAAPPKGEGSPGE